MRDAGTHHHRVRVTTDSALAEVAAELRLIEHGSGWSRTLAIGELMLNRFFDGNIQEWRTHRRYKEASIRRLAQRDDCPLSRSALSETIAVYVACRDLPVGKLHDQLSPSHVAAALRLGASQRIEVLERAMAGRLTVREVRALVSGMRKNAGERRGRPRSSPARAALTFIRSASLALGRAMALLRVAQHAESDLARRLEVALGQAIEQMAAVQARLNELSAGPRVTLAPPITQAHERVEIQPAAGQVEAA